MADTGWVTFGAYEAFDFGNAFANPTNAQVEDGVYMTGTGNGGGIDDNGFYDFDFASLIPSDARFDGLEIRIKGFCSLNGDVEIGGSLYWDRGVVSDVSEYEYGATLTDTNTNYTFNGASFDSDGPALFYKWSRRTGTGNWITMDDIRDPDFGVYLFNSPPSNGETLNYDYVAVKVYYTENFASTGATSPGTGSSTDEAVDWANPGNITSSDNTRATMTASTVESNNAYLRATNLGFNIPADATISGVEVVVERNRSGGTSGQINDNVIQLVTDAESLGSPTSTDWLTPTSVVNYEDSGNPWTNPNNSLVLDGSFAVSPTIGAGGFTDTLLFQFDMSSLPNNCRIDGVELRLTGLVDDDTSTSYFEAALLKLPDPTVWVNTTFDGFNGSIASTELSESNTAYTLGTSTTNPWEWHDHWNGFESVPIPNEAFFNNEFGTFVVAVYGEVDAGSAVFSLDGVELRVHYTPGFAGDGANLAVPDTNWPTTENTTTYGGYFFKWGLDLTPEIINSSDFGVQIRAVNTNNRVAGVDHVTINVYYTTADDPTPILSQSRVVFIGV